ncbi:hypothetical protein PHSY_007110 [Pseudozyma hubeiensis SY62]|uniref:Uncharacterized protein n=1 Tax=Pseudozyma hubeiensis (strain SY62) TaxID=1305764 RepID=R9PDP6_PSEHS|nr:hypothetical protein PHSY_007110 [Pseudozyma hubeiensis SY62]GAC99508.1 hypothetical protein PHSY_007110 [Pseudozyma hubeiensis SY62]
MSEGANFVKRSKPRSSASRISSTYDDDQASEAGPSNGFARASAASTSTKADSAATAIGRGSAGSDDDGASNVVFRARAKGARGTTSSLASTTASASRRSRDASPSAAYNQPPKSSAMDEDDAGDDGDAFDIRRSKPNVTGKHARRSTPVGQSRTTASTPKRSTPLRPTSFQQQPLDEPHPSTSTLSSSLYTSKYLDELRSSTPTLPRSRADSPIAALGPGTRIEDPMLITQASRLALDDDSTLARARFAVDFAHDAIPSERVIRAAKEKRAKLRAAHAASASTAVGDDFISLAPTSLEKYDGTGVDSGPHPHSRLQREEDELGDGEDEFSEFTGATDRIPIGESQMKEMEARQRQEMYEAIRGDSDDEMQDEEELEWEQAQLRRTQTTNPVSREASPFRSAPIPAPTPLPSVGTCSTRLELTLRALEQSISSSKSVVESTGKELIALEEAERENKLDVVAVEEKAAWFDEMEAFVVSLARFMEEKVARVEEVETRAMELLVRRNRIVMRTRGRWIDGRLRMCLGIVPGKSAVIEFDEEKGDAEMDTGDGIGDEAQAVDALQLDTLPPADESSFALAQQEILTTLKTIFADTQAPEYLDPAATTANTGFDTDLHPLSVVSRFQEWRRAYREEYAQVWGGLSLAQIWEFYARVEVIPYSPFSSTTTRGWVGGAAAISRFRWFTGASDYASRAVDGKEAVGGDDEVVETLMGNVLVKKLMGLTQGGAFSPWSAEEFGEAVEAVDLVQTVLGAGNARCEGLMESFLDVFQRQIGRLEEVMQLPSTAIPVGDRAQAGREVAEQLVQLLKNLIGWSRVIDLKQIAALAKVYLGLVESLLGGVVEVFASRLEGAVQGMEREVWGMVREVIPQHIVKGSERIGALLSRHC